MSASKHIPESQTPAWPERIHSLFRANDIRQVAYVPDGGHAELIERIWADDSIRLPSR